MSLPFFKALFFVKTTFLLVKQNNPIELKDFKLINKIDISTTFTFFYQFITIGRQFIKK